MIRSEKNLTITGNGSLTVTEHGKALITTGLFSKAGDIRLNGTGTLHFEGVSYAFDIGSGSINYENGTIDFDPETNTIGDVTYPIGALLAGSKKTALNFSGAKHDLDFTVSEKGETYETISAGEFDPDKQKYVKIVPQHHDVNKIVSAEFHASGTCEEGCTYYLSCDCGHISGETFQMPPEAHSLVKHAAKVPTCEMPGSPEYWECELCGGRYADADGTKPLAEADMVTAPLGHELVHKEASEATCTEDGVSEHWMCTRCGARFADKDGNIPLDEETAVTPAIGHNWVHYYAKSASCETDGCIEHWKCANCGKFSADSEGTSLLTADQIKVKALGHSWSEWTVSKKATASEEGEETRVCVHCEKTETRVIPVMDADFNGDGSLDVADAVLLTRFASEDDTLTEEQIDGIVKAKPDQDGDGIVTLLDVTAILKKLAAG